MANNPQYNSWMFRKTGAEPARRRPKPITDIIGETDLEDLDDDTYLDALSPLDRAKEIRRRIEILHEAKLLKSQLNDLW